MRATGPQVKANGGEGRFLVKTENTIEIDGKEKPAMVAEWLIMLVYPTSVDGPSQP